MNKIEKVFNINIVLLTVFSSLEMLRNEKNIELIYDICPTVPRELRGDPERLQRVLSQLLTFVFENSDQKEILLSLSSPEDFLVEENISFMIHETEISKDKVSDFLETGLSKTIEILEGKIVDDKTFDIYIDIPFKINELGFRRHYRLPDIAMMGKKILLLCKSEKVAKSIKKMFKYFLYNVDEGFEEFKNNGSDLAAYDILLLDDKYVTDEFNHIIAKVQQEIPLKYVLLRDEHILENTNTVSTHLIKPVTQESIYELIVSLFRNNLNCREIKPEGKKYILDIEKVLKKLEKPEALSKLAQYKLERDNLSTVIEEKRRVKEPVLDKVIGEENTKKIGLNYSEELQNFVETFDRSDRYFREIVNEKATGKIKEFCIDLEKNSKLIGAQSMFKLADTVSLIFVYDKLDLLPIYPGKYHLELEQLLKEIRKYLDA
ncbi:MAG: hypothetical protein COB07_08280 [Sulfurovum sp.]|nr:MAG: hypothetical protein COB07_08280 [Sulfurovum sp.]